MRATRRVPACLGVLVALAIAHPARGAAHRVAPGDCLVGILRRAHLRPIWGPSGSLADTLRLNPAIANPDHIQVGQHLVLPPARQGPPGPRAEAAFPLSPAAAEQRPEVTTAPCPQLPTCRLPPAAPCPPPTSGPAPPEPTGRHQERPALLQLSSGPTASLLRLAATDRAHGGRAHLTSLFTPGVEVAAEVALRPRLHALLSTSGRMVTFTQPASLPGLAAAAVFVGRAHLGLRLAATPRWALTAAAGLGREIFLAADDGTTAALRGALCLDAILGVERALWRSGPWSVDLAGRARVGGGPEWVGAGVEVDGLAQARLQPRASGSWLAGSLGASWRRQNTRLTRQSVGSMTVGLSVGTQLP